MSQNTMTIEPCVKDKNGEIVAYRGLLNLNNGGVVEFVDKNAATIMSKAYAHVIGKRYVPLHTIQVKHVC